MSTKNTLSCYLIHNNIFKNIKLLHVSARIGPSSGRVLVPVGEHLLNSILICFARAETGEILP